MLRIAFSVTMKLIDIGANLTDPMFQGVYHGKQKHESDYNSVLERAVDAGVEKMIVTGGSLDDSKSAINICQDNKNLFCTVGCHPTRCTEFSENPNNYLSGLKKLFEENGSKIVAVGECGLDYDRLHFCDKLIQLEYFEKQFELAIEYQLPMFLHSRNSHQDFISLMKKYRSQIKGGVVHSFTGTSDEAKEILSLDLFIGINGCSLKTQENVDAMKTIPSNRLLIETDCPWCEIKPSHVGYNLIKTKFPTKKKWVKGSCVKNRYEPCHLVQVLEVISSLREEKVENLAEIVYENTNKLFFDK